MESGPFVDHQQNPVAHGDGALRVGHSIADPTSRTCHELSVIQRPPEPGGRHATGIAADREDRHDVAGAAFDVRGMILTDHGDVCRADPPFNVHLSEMAGGDQQGVAQQVTESTAVTPDDDGSLETLGDHSVESQLEIGGVLVGGKPLNEHAGALNGGQQIEIDRVHIADDDVGPDSERNGMVEAGVRRNHPGRGRKIHQDGALNLVTAGDDQGEPSTILSIHVHSLPPLV